MTDLLICQPLGSKLHNLTSLIFAQLCTRVLLATGVCAAVTSMLGILLRRHPFQVFRSVIGPNAVDMIYTEAEWALAIERRANELMDLKVLWTIFIIEQYSVIPITRQLRLQCRDRATANVAVAIHEIARITRHPFPFGGVICGVGIPIVQTHAIPP